jgi:hypothetical protein
MPFSDYVFEIPTKAGNIRVFLTSDVFYCLCGARTQSQEEIVVDNLELIRDLAADRIEFGGFMATTVRLTAMDIEA